MPDDKKKTTKVPKSRVARTARFGSLVGGQGVKWTATNAANRLRSEESAQAAKQARAMDLADQLVKQLGQMKGAAMKIGQVLSTVDFELIPEGEREEFKQRLAALRDNAPQVSFKDMKKVAEKDLGGPLKEHFDEFDEEPVAAASIGQVYRARTHSGTDVAVKVQYPGVAEAVETDMRNMQMLVPFLKRMAPGMDAKALLAELRERISEELDYEIEAANQRQVGRAYRDHPFVRIPAVDTGLSTRRVLVTEFVEGAAFDEVKKLPEAERDRFAEIAFRFFYGLLEREQIAAGDPHPGNYLLCPDGKVCFLDFGLVRRVDPEYLAGEQALARAVIAEDADEVHDWMAKLGYLPDPDDFDPGRILGQLQAAGEWYFTTGFRRIDPEFVRQTMERSSPRSQYFDYMRMQTLPPQALLIRRMEGLLFGCPRRAAGRRRLGQPGARVRRGRARGDAARRGRGGVLRGACRLTARRDLRTRSVRRARIPRSAKRTMATKTSINGIDELKAAVGQELGVSDWYEVTQEAINEFAEVTQDFQWIHVDPERAKETPFGGTIAHGLYTLSLGPKFSYEIFDLQGFAFGVNYGYGKVRFPAPLPVGTRVRMRGNADVGARTFPAACRSR